MRNTPVCTGKTAALGKAEKWVGKHPRMHGENFSEQHYLPCPMETPPYARGKLNKLRKEKIILGNTPVCTGKTKDTLS